jgi:hypothetical protein
MKTASALVVIIFAASLPGFAQATAGDRAAVEEGYRQYYNGHYEAAVAAASPLCASAPLNLEACELTSAALHFQIRRALGPDDKKKKWEACEECPALMTSFLEVTHRGQEAARAIIETTPADDDTKFLLGKLDLNYVWLQLATIGKKTGWKEYWEARHLLDDLVKRRPEMVRAQIARAWIDYIVDTRMPRGTRWLLGGGDKKKGVRVIREAAAMPADIFVAAEATFALWDIQVREQEIPGAVATARKLASEFPENEELTKFLATNDPEARR